MQVICHVIAGAHLPVCSSLFVTSSLLSKWKSLAEIVVNNNRRVIACRFREFRNCRKQIDQFKRIPVALTQLKLSQLNSLHNLRRTSVGQAPDKVLSFDFCLCLARKGRIPSQDALGSIRNNLLDDIDLIWARSESTQDP